MTAPLHPVSTSLRKPVGPFVRLLIVLLVLGPLAIPVVLAAWPDADPVSAPWTAARNAADRRDEAGAPKPVLGFAINAHHISNLPLYLDGVDAIAALGANTLIVVTPIFQKKVDSSTMRYVRSRCPTDEQVSAILRRGKTHGMYTILMPIVLIENPKGKEWRGLIEPGDWDAWWASYRMNLGRFVALAEANDVDMLSVGSELNSTESQHDRWKSLIAGVRERYDGRLMYSSNWDRYDKVTLWPMVDVMAVSSYFEIERDRPEASVPDLVAAWRPMRDQLVAASVHWERPLLISEIGYPTLPWATAHPWNYVATGGAKADPAAQARGWTAFFEAWTDVIAAPDGNVLGFCGYRWDPYHRGGEDDTGYGIVGKPSREIIRRGFEGIRRTARDLPKNR